MSSKTRFQEEAKGNSEMAYSGACTNHKLDNSNSCSQGPCSFWSTPRIATSGRSDFLSMRREFVAYSRPIKFVRLEPAHAQSDGKSVNRGLPVLDLPRGRDSWG